MLKLAVDERELIQRLTQGDELAFKKIYDQYRNKLYTFCFKLTKSEEISLEIVQDVFLKIWIKRESIDPEQSFNSLLFTITKNLAINFIRKAAADKVFRKKLMDYHETMDTATEDGIIFSDYEHSLDKAIRHLPPQQQLVFTMSRIEGLTHAEIAQNLNLSKGTVKKYIMLAVTHVSRLLNLHSDKSLFLTLFLYSFIGA